MLLPISLLKYLLLQKLLLDGGRTLETLPMTRKLKNENYSSTDSESTTTSASESKTSSSSSSSSSSNFTSISSNFLPSSSQPSLLTCFTSTTPFPTSSTSNFVNVSSISPPTNTTTTTHHLHRLLYGTNSSTVQNLGISPRQIMPPVASIITINTIVTAVNLILIALIIIIEVAIAIAVPVIVAIIIVVVLKIVIPIIIGIIRGILGMIPFVKKALFRNVLNGQLGQNLKRALSKAQRWLRALGVKRERLLLQQLLSQHPDDWWHFVGTAWPDAQLDLAGQKLAGINRELDIIRRYLEFSKLRFYEEAKKQRKEYAKIKKERYCLLKTGFATLSC